MSYLTEEELLKLPISKYLDHYKEDIKLEVFNYLDQPDSMIDYPKYVIENEHKEIIPLYENFWKIIPFSILDSDSLSELSEVEKEASLVLSDRSKWNCPTLSTLISGLESEGSLVNCFVNKLLPGSIINRHRGWPLDFIRVYFCLQADSKCEILLDDKNIPLDGLLGSGFTDEETHSICHQGTSDQIFLSMDLSLSYVRKYL